MTTQSPATPVAYAVMNTRKTRKQGELDFFPTPAWGTRALLELLGPDFKMDLKTLRALEPACGQGHMSRVLKEYFRDVKSVDIADRGYGEVGNFLTQDYEPDSFDWVITNPPFNLAREFVEKSLKVAKYGSAFLVRTNFLETVGRYNGIFKNTPPAAIYQFVERLPMVKNRVDKNATTATSYCWVVFHKDAKETHFRWIPPCRKELERESDWTV